MARVAVYKNGAFQTIAGVDIPSTHGRNRNSSNTGVPDGTVFGDPEPAITVTAPGTIIEDRWFYGSITVQAADVTIRRCRIDLRFGGNYGLDATAVPVSALGNTYSLEIQDCDINGGLLGPGGAIFIGNYTAVRRCRIRGGDDCAKIAGVDSLLEDSWLYEQVQYPGGHNDALQTSGGSNTIIRRNKLEVNNAEFDTMYNSCFQIGDLASDLTDMTFEDNYVDGGNIQINGSLNSGGGITVSNAVFRRNRFGPNYRTSQTRGEVASGSGADWDDTNVDDLTGNPVA